ncbi:Hpt domain-containing protein [Streptomyces sp. NPDC005529]|uniref:Hpt domain-containing protein n=1 Tax=unclassified Streptomyces TaxID=2593676 RepID=UPI0033A7021F
MPAAHILNPQAVHSLVEELDAPFALNLIDAFLNDSPQQIRQIRQSLQKGDAEEVHRAAHTLKSHGDLFGLEEFGALCQKLEKITAAGELPADAAQIAEQVTEAHRLAQEALQELSRELAHD